MKHILTFIVAVLLTSCAPPSEMENQMIKLYRKSDTGFQYWETWENDGVHTVHWGTLGTRGDSKEITSSYLKPASKIIKAEIKKRVSEGYDEIDLDDHPILLIEYPVDGMGNTEDLDKRHALQDRMDQTLGWTGLGNCDGGSIGSGSMEVCCFVVDFDIAKQVIAEDLKETEFADYSRIYKEE